MVAAGDHAYRARHAILDEGPTDSAPRDGIAGVRVAAMCFWRADRSSVDGGKTWLRDAWTMEATRIAK